jgi:hypothetical protein
MNPYPNYGPPTNMPIQSLNMPPNMMFQQPIQYVFVQDPMGELANCNRCINKARTWNVWNDDRMWNSK